ncbi:response regulator [Azospirillum sp. HJ39]|uniref:response regulator n=1 Tax=Azospirillum sp. HJ39 TaxID=3159496 RepID=UPI0035580D37
MAKTILSVDDSASMRQMVKLTLSSAGYQVVEAADGREALAKAKTGSFNLVLTDLNMPNMDGLTLIRELRTLAAYRGIPIVFLTTESDAGKKAEAKAAGATAWIVKPFQPDQLLSVVRKIIGA